MRSIQLDRMLCFYRAPSLSWIVVKNYEEHSYCLTFLY